MANKQIPTISTHQSIPMRVGDFRNLPQIDWSVTRGSYETSNKYFTAGSDVRWEGNKRCSVYADDVWGNDSDDGFEVQVQEKSENWFIAYLDLDESRHFRVFSGLGFEMYQSGQDKGSLHLFKVGREYKKPGTGEIWSYSDGDLDRAYANKRGSFYHQTNFNADEISMQGIGGYILNRIYFNYRSSSSGGSGTGSAPYTEVQIYNMKLGWGSGTPSNKLRICLPKIRPWADAAQPQFGEP